jgi:hypothetical protein
MAAFLRTFIHDGISAQLAEGGGLLAHPLSPYLHPLLELCRPAHILAQNRYFITTQVMHGLRGQYSRVAMLSSGFHCVMFTL